MTPRWLGMLAGAVTVSIAALIFARMEFARWRTAEAALAAQAPHVAAGASATVAAVAPAREPEARHQNHAPAARAGVEETELELVRIMELTRNDPAVIQAGLEVERLSQGWRYADFFRQREIAGPVREQFLKNAFRRVADERDLLSAAGSLGLGYEDNAVRRIAATNEERYREAQRALLGAERLSALERYEQSFRARGVATGVAGMTALADAPMTIAQVRQLADVIERSRLPAQGLSVEVPRVDWPAVDAAARGFLSDRQHALFIAAEAPGVNGGGSRFMWVLSQAVNQAVHGDGAGKPAGAP